MKLFVWILSSNVASSQFACDIEDHERFLQAALKN